jgi:hypothetical protein
MRPRQRGCCLAWPLCPALPEMLPGEKTWLWTTWLSAGAPGRIRIPNPQIRSLVLYPIELRAQSRRGGVAKPRLGGKASRHDLR